MKKFLISFLAVMLLMCFCTSAYAATSKSFDGKCTSNFFTTKATHKQYSNENYASVKVNKHIIYSTGVNCGCTMRLYLKGSTTTKASDVMYVNSGDAVGVVKRGHLYPAYRDEAGVDKYFQLKVDNTYNAGTKIQVAGIFTLATSSN